MTGNVTFRQPRPLFVSHMSPFLPFFLYFIVVIIKIYAGQDNIRYGAFFFGKHVDYDD